ncbi:fungal-specific transcription factor domain-containing protein [Xylaria sp. FL1042]|nr:fungal-specific transcription factor domain-containing protein [Xylaria sp. FL1042]
MRNSPRNIPSAHSTQSGPSTIKPRESSHKACDACKRRKVRCSGTNPCQHCNRSNSNCSYSSNYGRITQLERRLRQYEDQVHVLEASWRRFMPHLDLEDAKRLVETEDPGSESFPLLEQATPPITTASRSAARAHQSEAPVRDTPDLEKEIETVEVLAWDETTEIGFSADGICSLTANSKASGYTGSPSGNALLRHLRSVGTFFSNDDDISPECPMASSFLDNTLNPEVELSSPALQNMCLDWYFEHFHKPYPLLHEGLFRAHFSGAVPKPKDGSWPVLSNMVLAMGAFSGPEAYSGYDNRFYNQARAAFSMDLLQRGSVPLVQALLLMANYLQKRNKINSGFTFLGIACNMAISLGMHREFSDKSVNIFDMEIQRRIWWTLYIFDAGARLTLGRPSMLLFGVNIKPPSNLDDCDLAVDMTSLKASQPYPTTTSSLIWQCKLAEISSMANAKLLERSLPLRSDMLSLDDQVSAWFEALPPFFKQKTSHAWFEIPRMVLLWRSQHLRIVILRPFLLDALLTRQVLDIRGSDGAVGRCILAAEECVQSINTFCADYESPPRSLAWYATYWVVTAVLISAVCLVYDHHHQSAPLWRAQVEETKTTLAMLSKVEPLAARSAQLLTRLQGVVPQNSSIQMGDVNESTIMGIADIWSGSWIYDAQLVEDLLRSS